MPATDTNKHLELPKDTKKGSASPQARWARRMVKMGRCRICGEKRHKYKFLCDGHQLLFSRYMRAWRARRKLINQTAKGAANVA